MLALFAPAVFAPGALAQNGEAQNTLSSSDVSEEEVESAAEIVVAMQMQQQELRKKMMRKYGNPQKMDSTQRRQARVEMMKQRQALMKEKTNEHGLSTQRLGMIMNSARQDSTLRERMKTAVQDLRQEGTTPRGMGGNGNARGNDTPKNGNPGNGNPGNGNSGGGSR